MAAKMKATRPHMRLRAGLTDVVVGYEAQGAGWNIYTAHDGRSPTMDEQQWFDSRDKAHAFWLRLCQQYLEDLADAHVSAAPVLTSWSQLFDLTSADDVPAPS